MAPVLLQVMVSDPKDIPHVDEMANVANDEATTKNGTFAVLDAPTKEKFRKRLVDVLDDAKRWGWL